jgi:hypothetical protein
MVLALAVGNSLRTNFAFMGAVSQIGGGVSTTIYKKVLTATVDGGKGSV